MPLPLRSMESGRDDVGLGAEADGGPERLAGQHVGAVELAGDHPVEQHLPVRLRLQGHEEPLVLEEALLVGDGQRRHVRQLDETELELVLLHVERLGAGPPDEGCGQAARRHRRGRRGQEPAARHLVDARLGVSSSRHGGSLPSQFRLVAVPFGAPAPGLSQGHHANKKTPQTPPLPARDKRDRRRCLVPVIGRWSRSRLATASAVTLARHVPSSRQPDFFPRVRPLGLLLPKRTRCRGQALDIL